MIQLGTVNGDFNIRSEVEVFSLALPAGPDGYDLRAEIRAGDGTKNFTGGGAYRVRGTVGGVEVFRSDVLVATGVTRRIFDVAFLGRPGETAKLLLLGQDVAGDGDVDVTTYLYDAAPAIAPQSIRDAMKLAPSAGNPAEKSVDAVLWQLADDMPTTNELAAAVKGAVAGAGDIRVDHDTGGADNLRCVDANGNGLDAVVVRAYCKADVVPRPLRDLAMTGVDGRWVAPMYLNAETYILAFSRHDLATVTKEVAVS